MTYAARNAQALPATERLYKVVGAAHESIHGGAFSWDAYLPDGSKPGAWTPELEGDLVLCQHAYHLTTEPYEWWREGSLVYAAEGRGSPVAGEDKRGYRAVRLLREVPWSDFQVFSEGTHTVTSGRCRAWGSATVRAWDSATVEASGSATVQASGSATVESTRWHDAKAQVALQGMAAHIDRRDGRLRLRGARGPVLEVPGE